MYFQKPQNNRKFNFFTQIVANDRALQKSRILHLKRNGRTLLFKILWTIGMWRIPYTIPSQSDFSWDAFLQTALISILLWVSSGGDEKFVCRFIWIQVRRIFWAIQQISVEIKDYHLSFIHSKCWLCSVRYSWCGFGLACSPFICAWGSIFKCPMVEQVTSHKSLFGGLWH